MRIVSIDVDNLLEAIRTRRTIKPKELKPDSVDDALIASLLEAARWAPCHGKTEPWRFVVFAGEARRALGEAIAAGYRADAEAKGTFAQDAFDAARARPNSAPVWIAIVMQPGMKPDGTQAMPEWEEMCAVACAVQNMYLVAGAQGLGGMWSTGGPLMHVRVQELLHVQKPAKLMGFFIVGWPAHAWPSATRRSVAEISRAY